MRFKRPAVRREDNKNYISDELLYIEVITAEEQDKDSFIFNGKTISITKVTSNEKEKEIFIKIEEMK